VGNVFDKLNEMGATTSFGETSEIMGAELICKERAATPEVGEAFMKTFNAYNDIIMTNKTNDLSGSQPTKGNIRGGLTTIEERPLVTCKKSAKNQSMSVCSNRPKHPPGRACGSWILPRRPLKR
jgi:(2R)-sulfolactate sulfo-lyase subunit beta